MPQRITLVLRYFSYILKCHVFVCNVVYVFPWGEKKNPTWSKPQIVHCLLFDGMNEIGQHVFSNSNAVILNPSFPLTFSTDNYHAVDDSAL